MRLIKADTDTFFDIIYPDLLLQFPESELKSFDKFKKLLACDEYEAYTAHIEGSVVGYVVFARFNNYIWIDYIAILKEFHSMGFGGTLLELLKSEFKYYSGIFLEVEMLNPEILNTIKRVKFYKNHGAKKLDGLYFYPNYTSDLQMDLYYIPLSSDKISGDTIINTIKGIFSLLHSDILHLDKVLSKIVF